jgi:hypothetical protein
LLIHELRKILSCVFDAGWGGCRPLPELRLRLARGNPNWMPDGVELRSLTGCMRKLTHTVCVSRQGNHINRKRDAPPPDQNPVWGFI